MHGAGGLIGAVERVDPGEPAQHGMPEGMTGSLLVRALDSVTGMGRRYLFPAALVREIGEETDGAVTHTVVRLALEPPDLDRYAIGDDLVPGLVREGETLRIPLVAEHLVAQTQPVQQGTVRLHKSVETMEQHLRVPLIREDVIVERIPADQYEATTPPDPEETIIPVLEERLVVETRTVIVEYIRVRKRRITEEQDLQAPVRREVVTVQELRAGGSGSGSSPADRPFLRTSMNVVHTDATKTEDEAARPEPGAVPSG